jgi:pimeloyl-ACP methyl ester carboxylesterase
MKALVISLAVICFALVCSTTALAQPAATGEKPSPAQDGRSFDLLNIDKQGKLLEPDEELLDKITGRFKADPPTHVFVLSHGWYNNKEAAFNSYQKMIAEMKKVADQLKLRPEGFKPAVVGLHWPSLAFEKDEELIKSLPGLLSKKNAVRLKLILELKYGIDDLQPLLTKKMSRDEVITLFALVRLYMGDAVADPDGKGGPDLKALDAKDLNTVLDAIRVFSFWQMKKRAGTVGANGVRRVLMELQTAAPKAEFHLVGHSFGCKVLLSALAGEDKQPPVNSLVLLQAAISTDAFAEKVNVRGKTMPAAYNLVLAQGRVKGPIVATFSDNDSALGLGYPPASRAAGQIAELEARVFDLPEKAYFSMGAVGIGGIDSVPARKDNLAYGFKNGLNNVNAADIIGGHNEFYNPEVARLIWAAVLRR